MNEISLEIVKKYQLRKNKAHKSAFRSFLEKKCLEKNIPFMVDEVGLFKSKNIVIGDIENSKLILTAHYDTAGAMLFPNFICTNKFMLIICSLVMFGPAYVILSGVVTFVMVGIGYFLHLTVPYIVTSLASLLLFMYCMVCLVNNPHTANDNTSGVVLLVEMIFSNMINFNEVCFVLFDHEELGLLGSSAFKKKYKKLIENKLVLNFDCIGDGDTCIFVGNKAVKKNSELNGFLKENLHSNEEKEVLVNHDMMYPSDQINFKYGIGVASFKKSKRWGYYIPHLHTLKDTHLDECNIAFLYDNIFRIIDKIDSLKLK